MAESILLNKTRIDLYGRKVTRRIQIADIADVAARKSSFSYTIKIPRTSRNVQIFDMLGTIGNTSRKPYENIIADYIVDGIFIVNNGIGIIRETNTDYLLNIIDGIRSLAELLAGKKLTDLPLTDLNHILTTQNYVDSFSNTQGYIYAMANYGRGVSNTLKVEKQAPSIFTHTLFRKIFESNGLSLQGDFFTQNTEYLNEVVTAAIGYEVQDVALTEDAKGSITGAAIQENYSSSEFIEIDQKFTLSGSGLTGAAIVGGDLQFTVAGTYRIDFDIDTSTIDTVISMNFLINDISVAIISLPDAESQTTTVSITFTVDALDTVQLRIIGSSYLYPVDGDDFAIDYSAEIQTSNLVLLTGGYLVEASNYLGDMGQMDFIKDVISRYGLLLNPIRNTSEYEFKSIEDLLNDFENAEDWTEKINELTENYDSGYSKINKATYEYPPEIVIPNNDGEMLIDNENATEESTMIASSFEIPQLDEELENEDTYLIPIWTEDEGGDPVNLETPLKIMKIVKYNVTINAKLFTEVTGIDVSADVPYLTLSNMSMQSFIDDYYAAFNDLINDFKQVNAAANLLVIDIYNLNFFKLKYLKQTQRYYYLISVLNTAGKFSKVIMNEVK